MGKFEAYNKIAYLLDSDWSDNQCEFIGEVMKILAYENCSPSTRGKNNE